MSRQTLLLLVALTVPAWGQKAGNGFSLVIDGKAFGIYESAQTLNVAPAAGGAEDRHTGRRSTRTIELKGGPLNPELSKLASTGKELAEVKIGMCHPEGSSSYRVMSLRKVIVAKVNVAKTAVADRPSEDVSFVFEEMREDVVKARPEGCK